MLVVLLVVSLVYWPGLGGGYVFDDFPNIVDNTALHLQANASWRQWLAAMFSSPASELQRPLAMLSFAINHALTGLDPYWMKLTNVGIHLFNTILVFGLARQLLRAAPAPRHGQSFNPDWAALWIAAAWALNPINLMAVLFVVQRMESLSHTFVFAGLWLYMVARVRLIATGTGWLPLLGGLIAGTALGVLSKESAVLLPVYALALEWSLFRFSGLGGRTDRRLVAVFGVVLVAPAMIGLAWLLPTVMQASAYARRSFTLGERLLTEGRVLLDYLQWTLLPNLNALSLYHDDYPVSRGWMSPPSTLLAWLVLAALFGAMVWLRGRRPMMALGLAWFFAAHLLTATVIPLELVYEHRNYFASLGLCLVLADLLLRAPSMQTWRRSGIAVAIMLLALYTGLTALRAREWNDQMRFSLTEAAKHPESPRATYDVARNFLVLSDYDPDSPHVENARLALNHAMRVPGSTALPEAAAITLAARTAQPIDPDWWDSLQQKLGARSPGPQELGALSTLVSCQMQQQCNLPSAEMQASFAAASTHGEHAEVLNIQGNYALNVQDDPTQALRLWEQSARLAPTTVRYQETLARMLIATGKFDAASDQIARVRSIGRLGQNAHLADELERLAAQAQQERYPQPHD